MHTIFEKEIFSGQCCGIMHFTGACNLSTQLESWLLHLRSGSLLLHLGKQQKMDYILKQAWNHTMKYLNNTRCKINQNKIMRTPLSHYIYEWCWFNNKNKIRNWHVNLSYKPFNTFHKYPGYIVPSPYQKIQWYFLYIILLWQMPMPCF